MSKQNERGDSQMRTLIQGIFISLRASWKRRQFSKKTYPHHCKSCNYTGSRVCPCNHGHLHVFLLKRLVRHFVDLPRSTTRQFSFTRGSLGRDLAIQHGGLWSTRRASKLSAKCWAVAAKWDHSSYWRSKKTKTSFRTVSWAPKCHKNATGTHGGKSDGKLCVQIRFGRSCGYEELPQYEIR